MKGKDVLPRSRFSYYFNFITKLSHKTTFGILNLCEYKLSCSFGVEGLLYDGRVGLVESIGLGL